MYSASLFVLHSSTIFANDSLNLGESEYTPIPHLPFARAEPSTNTLIKWNFGNGYFGTTAVASAGLNGNGAIFEYDVPTGYYALNTKNINTYG